MKQPFFCSPYPRATLYAAQGSGAQIIQLYYSGNLRYSSRLNSFPTTTVSHSVPFSFWLSCSINISKFCILNWWDILVTESHLLLSLICVFVASSILLFLRVFCSLMTGFKSKISLWNNPCRNILHVFLFYKSSLVLVCFHLKNANFSFNVFYVNLIWFYMVAVVAWVIIYKNESNFVSELSSFHIYIMILWNKFIVLW